MSEAALVPDNSLFGSQHISEAFEFLIARNFPGLRVGLSSYFSMLYLSLPLKSLGINPAIVQASTLFREADTIYDDGLVSILSLPEGIVTFLDDIQLLPY
ncbi:MAG: hypothetical protein QXV08_08445 [Desulfurococcus sp.]|uniref:hypothetical protein n=1 Tax=Desulfurococcus sp. TaxID=51678 RepID=UPI00317E618A